METIIKSCDRTITAEEIIPLLNKYGMLKRLAYEDIIDRAISNIKCTPQEIAIASKLLQRRDSNPLKNQALLASAIRSLKLEKFKQQTWGDRIPAFFAQRRKQLDRVVYSIVKTKQKEVIREIHFRLIEAEQTFADLSEECTGNPALEASESIGLVELGSLSPLIAKQLPSLKVGCLSAPILVKNSYVILRLDKYVSAQCNRPMQKRLIDELFKEWMQRQLTQQQYHLEHAHSLQ